MDGHKTRHFSLETREMVLICNITPYGTTASNHATGMHWMGKLRQRLPFEAVEGSLTTIPHLAGIKEVWKEMSSSTDHETMGCGMGSMGAYERGAT